MRNLIFLLLVTSGNAVQAFPQMIRHGYTSCNTCHAAPRGGGILTDYGRALSKELLSTWSYEGEENWHHGLVDHEKIPKWFKLGGDFRSVQVHSKDQMATIGRFIEMQEQVEIAVQHKSTWVSLTAASDTLIESKPWYIPGFFVSTQITPELHVRAGKFVPRFGINAPEHIFSTRGAVGFGYQTERETLEMTYITPKWDVSLAAVTGQLKDGNSAEGFYSQFNYSFGSKDRVGLSFEQKTEDDEALALGAHALIGFTEKLYLITDTVWRQVQQPSQEREQGLFHFAKLGYEIEKGLHIILIEDIKKTNLDAEGSTQSMYGFGFTFFPRPHLEFQGVWTRRTNLSRSREPGDYAWFLMHYYL
jgi:hypothetical protein